MVNRKLIGFVFPSLILTSSFIVMASTHQAGVNFEDLNIKGTTIDGFDDYFPHTVVPSPSDPRHHFLLDLENESFRIPSSFPDEMGQDPSVDWIGWNRPQIQLDILGTNQSITLSAELTANTATCRETTQQFQFDLWYLQSEDGTVFGNGWHIPEANPSTGSINWNISYSLFAPDDGWIDQLFTNTSNGSAQYHTELVTFATNQSNQTMPRFNTNGVGLPQRDLNLVRTELLFHDPTVTDTVTICKIVNEMNTFFRQESVFIGLEALTDVNPNDNSMPARLNWPDPGNSCHNDQLPYAIRDFETSHDSAPHDGNYYYNHIDMTMYLFWDNGIDHDGLDWGPIRSMGSLGCTLNYYTQTTTGAGKGGVGEGWTRLIEGPVDHLFIRSQAILLAHEIGHALGASHQHARTSHHSSQSSGLDCLGDGVNDGVANGHSASSEGEYHSIMRQFMPNDVVTCYGVPAFTAGSAGYWSAHGALPGLPYRQIQPAWTTNSTPASSLGPAIQYWFAQIENEILIDPSSTPQQVWRFQYHLLVTNTSSQLYFLRSGSQPCINNIYALATSATTSQNWTHTLWQGERTTSICGVMHFENGNVVNYWPAVVPTNTRDYNGNGLADDAWSNQMCDLNNSGACQWIVWPVFIHIGQTVNHSPSHWMALTWDQQT